MISSIETKNGIVLFSPPPPILAYCKKKIAPKIRMQLSLDSRVKLFPALFAMFKG